MVLIKRSQKVFVLFYGLNMFILSLWPGKLNLHISNLYQSIVTVVPVGGGSAGYEFI